MVCVCVCVCVFVCVCVCVCVLFIDVGLVKLKPRNKRWDKVTSQIRSMYVHVIPFQFIMECRMRGSSFKCGGECDHKF